MSYMVKGQVDGKTQTHYGFESLSEAAQFAENYYWIWHIYEIIYVMSSEDLI